MLAQLSCEVRILRRVAPTVFHPAPNVDSALVLLRRDVGPAGRRAWWPSCTPASRTGARRSAARWRSRPARPRDLRDRTRAALEAIGHPPDARAERLAPADWERLAATLGEETLSALRPREA